MNPLNILMAQSDRFFKNNQKDPAPPAALLSFSFMSSMSVTSAGARGGHHHASDFIYAR